MNSDGDICKSAIDIFPARISLVTISPSSTGTERTADSERKPVKLYLGVNCYFLFISLNEYIYLSVLEKSFHCGILVYSQLAS